MESISVDVAQGRHSDEASRPGWIRWERVQALKGLRVVQDEPVIRGLVRALSDPSWEVRRAAEEGLHAAGDLVVLPLLEELVQRGVDTRLTEGSWRVLKGVNNPSLRNALGPLLEALQDPAARAVLSLEASEVLDRVRREPPMGKVVADQTLSGGWPRAGRR